MRKKFKKTYVTSFLQGRVHFSKTNILVKEKEGRVLSKLKRMTTANETKEDRCVLSWKNRTDF